MFKDVKVGKYIFAKQVQFTNATQTADFSTMMIGASAVFDEAIFSCPVDFNNTSTRYNFSINKTLFKNTEAAASFSSMKIGNSLSFLEAIFEGPASFNDTEINGDLIGMDARFNAIDQIVYFEDAKVRGYIYLARSKFAGSVSFINATTEGLYANDVEWPESPNGVNFNGFQYSSLGVWDSNDVNWSFLRLIERSPYSGNSYQMLEDYYLFNILG